MIIIHGQGGHGKVVADACLQQHGFTDDQKGTRPGPDDRFICAIGDNRVRAGMCGNISVVHRTAIIAEDTSINKGVYIGARAVLNPGVRIGNGVIVNTGAIIEHDCRIGSFAHIAPNATLCGNVRIGEGVLVGANATVKPGTSIGAWATIGCGSVVVKNVPPGETWAGNPARKI